MSLVFKVDVLRCSRGGGHRPIVAVTPETQGFGPEGVVLIDMLMAIGPAAHIITLDTGRLHPSGNRDQGLLSPRAGGWAGALCRP